jgi:hypothetical protein
MSSSSSLARCGAAAWLLVIAGAAVLAACSSQEIPPRSALDLMRDPAVRDAVLLRCNQLQGAALRDAECRNVREAVDRLAAEEQEIQTEQEHVQATDDSFEKARAERRARDERERRRREADEAPPVDAYTMPLVPEQPTVPETPTAAVMSTASLPDA